MLLLYAAEPEKSYALYLTKPAVWFAVVKSRPAHTVAGRFAQYRHALGQPTGVKMLEALGYKPKIGTLRLLERFQRTACCARHVNEVLNLDEKQRWALPMLYQLITITADVLEVIKLGREYVGWPILVDASMSCSDIRVTWQVMEARRLWTALRGKLPYPYRKLCLTQLQASVNRLTMEMEHPTFPPVPLPGTPNIIPILTAKSLLDEGRHLAHCGFGLRERVVANTMYFYRMLKPRATILIFRYDTYWALFEFKLARNHEPPEEAWREVLTWLEVVQHLDLNRMQGIMLNHADASMGRWQFDDYPDEP